MIGSLFTRFQPTTTDSSDCAALEEESEWNELIAWAGVESDAGVRGARASAESSEPGADRGDSGEAPTAESANADGDNWDDLIAQVKATTAAPEPIDEISTRRARLAERAQPAPDLGLDSWDLAILRAKRG